MTGKFVMSLEQSTPDKPAKKFDFMRYFLIISLMAFLGATILLGLWVRDAQLLVGIVAVLSGLYGVLWWTIRRADREIKRQAAERDQVLQQVTQVRDKVMDVSRMKSQILANVGHDARTPLNVITARAEMLRMGLYGPLNEKQDEIIANIMLQADHLLAFIENLLDQAQIEAGYNARSTGANQGAGVDLRSH
jgi:signal transduction histidine kinase